MKSCSEPWSCNTLFVTLANIQSSLGTIGGHATTAGEPKCANLGNGDKGNEETANGVTDVGGDWEGTGGSRWGAAQI